MKRILITGAAGYLGQSIGRFLHRSGYQIIGIDNYSTSSKPTDSPFEILEVDLTDLESTLEKLQPLSSFEGVLHFAAKALVEESFREPAEYYRNNLLSTINIAEACRILGVKNIVHSSSCAVYGSPVGPLNEEHPLSPISPYGASKKLSEEILRDFAQNYSLNVLALRYFNPAGALKKEGFGERHEPETHLLPRTVEAALTGQSLKIFGSSHPTPDGTCVRDYIHVEDLALAHQKALEHLMSGRAKGFLALNVGTGRGVSVFEMVQAVEQVLKISVPVEKVAARTGDPASLTADVSRFKDVFGWLPELKINDMVQDHWDFVKTFR